MYDQISEFMVKEVFTVDLNDTIYDAAEIMTKNAVSCLVVMDRKIQLA